MKTLRRTLIELGVMMLAIALLILAAVASLADHAATGEKTALTGLNAGAGA